MKTDPTIANIFPWGRSFGEYRRMFSLSDADLELKILDGAGGPASFNAEMYRQGHCVISCDPLYQFDAAPIRRRIEMTAQEMVRRAKQDNHRFVWDRIGSPEQMGQLRLATMEIFLADYEMGRNEKRYRAQQLPSLEFADGQFDLALCSHFLFLYSDELPTDFHIAATGELCRIAKEVRIFPLLNMRGGLSPHVEPVLSALRDDAAVSVEHVDYEFQRGGNQMIRICRTKLSSSS